MIRKASNWKFGTSIPFKFHSRSRTDQIIPPHRYDNYNADKPEMMKRRKHIRSNSCDVKIGRSNSREYDADYRNRRLHQNRSHSRTNSRDIDVDARLKRNPAHSRTNSRDEPINMKFILNCLKPELLGLPPPVRSSRKHSRNHSYDQIYNMPNNIKFDQELHNKFNKNRNKPPAVGGVTAATVIENDLVKSNAVDQKYVRRDSSGPSSMLTASTVASHSRTNSKDLNKSSFLSSLVDDAAHSILRHRRTNSKDLNRIVNATAAPIPSTSAGVCEPGASGCSKPPQHRRNLSQTNVEFPEEDTLDVLTSAAQVLLQRNNYETSDNIDTDMQRNNN